MFIKSGTGSSRLIATRADENHKQIAEITHPNIKRYADFCKADFLSIEDCKDEHRHYRILQFYNLFDEYDRILSIDTDILVLKTCPDVFEIVKYEDVGSIFEDVGSRKKDRKGRILKIQDQFGDIGWTSGYINTGFAVFSKCHKEIFKKEDLYMDLGYDDVWLGYRIRKFGFKIHELPIQMNFMSMFTEPWSNEDRTSAHVLHYAGKGFYPFMDRVKQIKQDFLILNKYNLLR